MKTCTVYGDMSADSAADQYPTVMLCDACVYEARKRDDSQIVSVEDYDSAYGESCEWCDKKVEEEKAV